MAEQVNARLLHQSVSKEGIARLFRKLFDEFYIRPAASLLDMVERFLFITLVSLPISKETS